MVGPSRSLHSKYRQGGSAALFGELILGANAKALNNPAKEVSLTPQCGSV